MTQSSSGIPENVVGQINREPGRHRDLRPPLGMPTQPDTGAAAGAKVAADEEEEQPNVSAVVEKPDKKTKGASKEKTLTAPIAAAHRSRSTAATAPRTGNTSALVLPVRQCALEYTYADAEVYNRR